MSANSRTVLLDAPDFDWASSMKFMLTYEGPLMATQRDPMPGQPHKHGPNKRDIRAVFHKQLKELWNTTPSLKGEGQFRYTFMDEPGKPPHKPHAVQADELAVRHSHFGWNFVPLVTEELDLLCSIDVLLLRPDRPGHVVWAGDIDNRLKTLLDALKIPDAGEEYVHLTPPTDETPFFVLLEDDKLITRVAVQTERMLAPVAGNQADVRLFITVEIKPYSPAYWNAHLG